LLAEAADVAMKDSCVGARETSVELEQPDIAPVPIASTIAPPIGDINCFNIL
jgi:hypothetical protein